MILGNEEEGYLVKSSSDTSVNRAIDRVISDVFQNISFIGHRLTRNGRSSHKMIEKYQIFADFLKDDVSLEELETNRFSSDSVFDPTRLNFLATASDEPFKPWNYYAEDFYDELQNLLDIFRRNNYDFYFKDFGWMGFPTVQIFCPEIQGYKYQIYDRQAFWDKRVFPNLYTQEFRKRFLDSKLIWNDPEICQLIQKPEFLYHIIFKNPENVSILLGLPQGEGNSSKFDAWAFLGLIALNFNNIDLAFRFFSACILENPQNNAFQKIQTILAAIVKIQNDDESIEVDDKVEQHLENLRTEFELMMNNFSPEANTTIKSLNKIIETLIDMHQVSCPFYEIGCSNCNIRKTCAYGKTLPLLEKIHSRYSDKVHFINFST